MNYQVVTNWYVCCLCGRPSDVLHEDDGKFGMCERCGFVELRVESGRDFEDGCAFS